MAVKHTPALPPPPEAASLGKFGQLPVSLYTGIPQISIPIHSLQIQGVTVPISLDYHAGGIRASEMASTVGLGWALQAGGLVSNTTNGLPDFSLRGYARAGRLIPTDRMLRPFIIDDRYRITNADYDFAMEITGAAPGGRNMSTLRYGYDTQPDVFQYSFAGRSGQFFHTQDGVAHPMPFESLAIQRRPGNLGPYETGSGYTITDEQGTVYLFDQPELTTTTTNKYGAPMNPTDDPIQHTLVYHLSRIENVQGESIIFRYDTIRYTYKNVTSRTRFRKLPANTCSPQADCYTESSSSTQGLFIKEIRSSLGPVVRFEYAACRRLDLAGSRALSAVVVQDGGPTRRFELQQGYFGSAATSACDYVANQQSTYQAHRDYYRLKLTGVREVGKPAYGITYAENSPLSMRLNGVEDHWGFMNGAGGNVPFPRDPTHGFYDGYSKEPDSTYLVSGMIRELRYPTGGRTRFVFEPNGYRVREDSVMTTVSRSVSFYASDSVLNYQKTIPFALNTVDPASILIDFDGPPCSQANPQLKARIFSQNNLIAEYCGRSPAGGQSGSQGGGPPLGYSRGNYTLSVDKYGVCEGSYFRMTWQEQVKVPRPAFTRMTGGVRIREIQDYDALSATPASRRVFYYSPLADTTRSSGVTTENTPVYTSTLVEYQRGVTNGVPDPSHVTGTCNFLMQTTNSQLVLGSIKGNSIAYTSVLVLTDKHGETGLTQHRFSFAPDYQPYAGYPFTQPTSHDWERGLPVEETTFAFHPTQRVFAPVRRVRSHYAALFTPPNNASEDSTNYTPAAQVNETHAIGLNFSLATPEFLIESTPSTYVQARFNIQAYKLISTWVYKDSEEEYLFNPADSTRFSVTTRTFRYDNPRHAQMTASTATVQAGETLTSRFSYPLDFDTAAASSAGARAVRGLARRHQLAAPVEKQELRTRNGSHYVIGGELLEYEGKWPRLLRTFVTNAPVPVALAPLASSQAGTIAANARYQDQIVFDLRDRAGHLLEFHAQQGRRSSAVYDQIRGHQLAAIQNSTYNRVAYTSFEPGATGRWQYDSSGVRQGPTHFTGTVAHQLDGSAAAAVSRTNLPAGNYELWLWSHGAETPLVNISGGTSRQDHALIAKGPTLWQQHRFRLTVPANGTVTLNSAVGSSLWIDELRLHPADARMTSFTYEPLVGMTSRTDPSGRTTTFEYDTLGRLLRTRDEQGRILSQQQYHYAGH